MENVKTTNTIKHFSSSEKAILKPYTTGVQKLTNDKCAELSRIIDRHPSNIYQYVYRQLRKLGNAPKKIKSKKVTEPTVIAQDKSVKGNAPLFKHGEFVIPVSSWEVRSNNGNTSLVLKFDKSI